MSDRRLMMGLCKKVITKETNPEVMRICYENGWSKSPDYMTNWECSKVKNIAQVFRGNKVITSFNEFKYFTGQVSGLWESFAHCTNLESIELPKSIKNFSNTFTGCTNLKRVILNEGLEECYGFGACSNLEYIYLPKTLRYFTSKNKNIEYNPFPDSTKLATIEIHPDNPYLQMDNGILRSDTIIWGNITSKDIESYILPESITTIAGYAFNASKLKLLTANSNLEKIGAYAFQTSTNLERIDLSNSKVTELSVSCFRSCTKLNSIILSDTLQTIGGYAFYGCSSLTNITLPESLLYISSLAFANTKLETIYIPKNVEVIMGRSDVIYAEDPFKSISTLKSIKVDTANTHFYDIDGVLYCRTMTLDNKTITNRLQKIPPLLEATTITIPEGITSISGQAGRGLQTITTINFPITLETIGTEAFQSSSITYADLSKTKVTEIQGYCFESSKIETCILNPNTTKIGYRGFHSSNLQVLQNTLNITEVAYFGLGNIKLTELNLPSLTTLEDAAIRAIPNLESVVLGNVNSLKDSFGSCPKLSSIKIMANTAPITNDGTFGTKVIADTSLSQYTGYTSGVQNKLLIPRGATGYNEGRYLDPLQATDKCNFIIEEYD